MWNNIRNIFRKQEVASSNMDTNQAAEKEYTKNDVNPHYKSILTTDETPYQNDLCECEQTKFPLAIAIYKLRKDCGEEFMRSQTVLNALGDYKAFDGCQPARAIFKVLYTEGFYFDFINLPISSNWINEIKKISNRLSNQFGFKEELVNQVLSNILLGFGKCSISEVHSLIAEMKTTIELDTVPNEKDNNNIQLKKDFNDDNSSSLSTILNKDILFDDAARLIVDYNTATTSFLQRRFNIGYNRASKIMDQLEQAGIVGPALGGKPRTILVHRTKETDSKQSSNTLSDSTSQQSNKNIHCSSTSHIVFLGKELGCKENEMSNHLENRGFKHIGFSYDGTRAEYSGPFLSDSDSVVAIWKTPKTKVVWRIEIRVKVPIGIIREIYLKKYAIEKLDYSDTNFQCKLPLGTIYVRENSKNSTTIEYEDNESFKQRQFEINEKKRIEDQLAIKKRNEIINRAILDEI